MEMKDQTTNTEEEALVEKPKLDFDRVLEEEIGQYGRYQFRTQAISSMFVMFIAIMANEYVFTAPRVRTRCLIPECENISNINGNNFTSSWLTHALPINDDGTLDQCLRYAFTGDNTTINDSLASNDSCPADMFDVNTTVPCTVYVYENENSAVYDINEKDRRLKFRFRARVVELAPVFSVRLLSLRSPTRLPSVENMANFLLRERPVSNSGLLWQFDLACDEWRRSMIGSVSTVGTLFANPLTGFISDRWGRRTCLTFNILNASLFGLSRYWTNSYVTFLVTLLCGSIFHGGIYSCIYILLMESVGPKYRILAGAITSTNIVIGHVLLVSIAWAVPNWRNMTLTIYIVQLLILPLILLTPDSVRWYIGKGKFEKAEKVIKDMAHINRKQLSTNTLLALKESIKSEKEEKSDLEEENEEWLIVQVFRHKAMLLRCLVSPVQWITLTIIYYGLSVNSVNLTAGGKFTNYLTVSLSEIPGYWIAVFSINRIGRKPVLAGGYWICALAMIAYTFVPDGYKSVSLTLYMLGKCGISTVVVALYLYTSELYPTKYRHRLVAFSSMMGRFGSIIAPLTPAFGGNIPFLMFGALGLVSGLSVLLTPETRGCQLPETMEDAVNIGRRRKPSH